MSSLVNLIAKKQKSYIKESFNLTDTNDNSINRILGYGIRDEELPVQIDQNHSWEYIHNRDLSYLFKNYRFRSVKHMMYFLNEAIKESQNLHHFPEILIKEMSAEVKLFTQDINDVSETDKKLSVKFDNIFSEIRAVY